jgi:hypothetical protein
MVASSLRKAELRLKKSKTIELELVFSLSAIGVPCKFPIWFEPATKHFTNVIQSSQGNELQLQQC